MLSRALRRLQREAENIENDESLAKQMKILNKDDQDMIWRVSFNGPEHSLYEGEEFVLQFTFEQNYPIEAPEVVFVGKPPIHEHVYSNGFICLSILYTGWKPSMTVASTVLSIVSMLASAEKKKKPKNDKEMIRTTKGERAKDQEWIFEDDTC
ncbi:unnamed protein product [Blepharisma stoltei]|uniref:UBC core domain-containing protein n=1 Tax=Blepharisma stoltei TaxID=1481888 RepID=A0AAU9K5Z9_9CILI|nr:unnamed protein product [Blepharisma stoltei]